MKKHLWILYIALLFLSVAIPAIMLYDWNRPRALTYTVPEQDDPKVLLDVQSCSFKGRKIRWTGTVHLEGHDMALEIHPSVRNTQGQYIIIPKASESRPGINEASGHQTWFEKYGFDAALNLLHQRKDYLQRLYIVVVTENGDVFRKGYDCEDD